MQVFEQRHWVSYAKDALISCSIAFLVAFSTFVPVPSSTGLRSVKVGYFKN